MIAHAAWPLVYPVFVLCPDRSVSVRFRLYFLLIRSSSCFSSPCNHPMVIPCMPDEAYEIQSLNGYPIDGLLTLQFGRCFPVAFPAASSLNEACEMSEIQRLDAHTATLDQSVWRPLSQKKFLQNVVDLHRASNKIPSHPKVHTRIEWPAARIQNDIADYVLPFKTEPRLADDLAFIAAAEEGLRAISAVGLKQTLGTHGLLVCLPANETITQDVPHTFEKMFDLLSRCATRPAWKLSKSQLSRYSLG